MKESKVARVMIHLRDYIPDDRKLEMQEILENSTDCVETLIAGMHLKSAMVTVILSIFWGELGIDRFYVGDFGWGLLKLFTLGGFGIWWFIDIFCCFGKAKKRNYKDIKNALGIFD